MPKYEVKPGEKAVRVGNEDQRYFICPHISINSVETPEKWYYTANELIIDCHVCKKSFKFLVLVD